MIPDSDITSYSFTPVRQLQEAGTGVWERCGDCGDYKFKSGSVTGRHSHFTICPKNEFSLISCMFCIFFNYKNINLSCLWKFSWRFWEKFPLFPSTRRRAARSTWARSPSIVTSSVPRAPRWTSWYHKIMMNLWVLEIIPSPASGAQIFCLCCKLTFVKLEFFCSTERVSSTRTIQDCLGRLQTGDRTHWDRRLNCFRSPVSPGLFSQVQSN